MKINKLPTLKYLNECFKLSEASTSGLVWKKRPQTHFRTYRGFVTTNSQWPGKDAGCFKDCDRTTPCYTVRVNNVLYHSHRIVYFIYNNIELNTHIQIDHIDGNRQNNLPFNLRIARNYENMSNRGKTKANTSGHKCVFWCKMCKAWYGKVVVNKVVHRTGYSSSKEAIVEIVKELREKVQGKFHNHGE